MIGIFVGVAVALGSDFNPNAYCMSMVSEYTTYLCQSFSLPPSLLLAIGDALGMC